ncbi:hypothetical protein LH435_15755 [Laribacter hongkongensis]|uniref:HEPN domain-containing protein n=1 Tax=Laribacter hongkongensis TaxID=168471 RepID=UPI001EFD1D30|nr:HEPN domain-containing protein [Laribacter hongkongensis]MCG8996729.1 hypothetical protein [Laribacter hongkongensis]MCG9011968.1 hypothetical protein [Laribacter hongkongensis]MCG9048474.1 hypothetical protein [Laribacter hongkongensis]MCG9075421.1 hypothetical protein [Laribacter hongkongensis]
MKYIASIKEQMREWFFDNFEDPAERTPYESREGGYQWVYGGPYDAEEELMQQFGDSIDDSIIKELARELSRECDQWAPKNHDNYGSDNYLDEFYDDLLDEHQNNPAERKLNNHLNELIQLTEVSLADAQGAILRRLLHANIIASLEAYLHEFAVTYIASDPKAFRRLVEEIPEYQNEKITLSELFKTLDSIDKKVKDHLAKMVWHRLDRVAGIFKKALLIDFPENITWLDSAIKARHDIVHRNGFRRDGQLIEIDNQEVIELIESVRSFVAHIEAAYAAQVFKQDSSE